MPETNTGEGASSTLCRIRTRRLYQAYRAGEEITGKRVTFVTESMPQSLRKEAAAFIARDCRVSIRDIFDAFASERYQLAEFLGFFMLNEDPFEQRAYPFGKPDTMLKERFREAARIRPAAGVPSLGEIGRSSYMKSSNAFIPKASIPLTKGQSKDVTWLSRETEKVEWHVRKRVETMQHASRMTLGIATILRKIRGESSVSEVQNRFRSYVDARCKMEAMIYREAMNQSLPSASREEIEDSYFHQREIVLL